MEDPRNTPSHRPVGPAPNACQGRAVTIMGLGLFGGGVAAARYFAVRGAHVTVTDLKGADALAPSLKALEGLPITFHLGGHRASDFTGADIVAVSPAVKKSSEFLQMAVRAGAEITCEMNLFVAACPAPLLGVTGSNGKSTTASLAADMLARHRPSRLGGNIGKSLLGELDDIRPHETVVLELSSFQLQDLARLRRSPRAAVVTNISENHLDHHGDMPSYINAKKNILRFQSPGDLAVLNADDPEVRSWQQEARGRVVPYSIGEALAEGVFAEGERVTFRLGGREERADLTGRIPLLGRHNLSNILAAATAARLLDVPVEAIAASVAAFRPLPHRLEPVGRRDGVLFVNDSKATTPLAARAAIEAFDRPIVLIAGGYDKKADPAPMVEAIRRGVRAVVLIGETAGRLQDAIGRGGPAVERADTLEAAVGRAIARARPGDVVLLSTGHASWDMFENYEQRGDAFRKAAQALGMLPLTSP